MSLYSTRSQAGVIKPTPPLINQLAIKPLEIPQYSGRNDGASESGRERLSGEGSGRRGSEDN